MSLRNDLTVALSGGTADTVPLSSYPDWFMQWPGVRYEDPSTLTQHPELRPFLDMGLGLVWDTGTVEYVYHGVQWENEERNVDGRRRQETRLVTPAGTVRMVRVAGWTVEHFIKAPSDYRVLQWMMEHAELRPSYEQYDRAEAAVGENGIVVVAGSRTPAMCINVDWAGTERFCLDLADEVEELYALYRAMTDVFLRETEILAAGPGSFAKWNENLTISMLGPRRYRELLMPLYQRCVPMLESAGKRVMVHYDGALRAIANDIAQAPFHIHESLTEPPEGDMWYDECRATWPDKAFWANINVGAYALPPDELKAEVRAKCARAGAAGLAFEISEELPSNWRETVPVVLEALREVRGT